MSDNHELVETRPPQFKAWLWVPTLYFAESIPNAIVSDTAKFLYTDLGLTPARLGLITGSMYLPWVLKPLWSPLVELVKTKRWWIIAMQLILGACFFGLAAAVWGASPLTAGTATLTPNWLVASAAVLWIVAFVSATHDIAADGFYMLGLSERDQAGYTGVRSTAYRLGMLCAKGFLVAAAGRLTLSLGVAHGWSSVFSVPAALYVAGALYHFFVLPHPEKDVPSRSDNFLEGYLGSFTSFFLKPGERLAGWEVAAMGATFAAALALCFINVHYALLTAGAGVLLSTAILRGRARSGLVTAILFMLLFRFAEAQLLAMVAPFLKQTHEQGGLALTTEQVGFAYGTAGMVGIICGGLSAGFLVARYGLRRMYWFLIFTMHLPNIAFLYLAYVQPTNIYLISAFLFLEQFGYGFGFTAYMLFLMYFSKGNQQTAHYAICTGFMALSLMLPQMVSGVVQEQLGFRGFFVYIIACTIPSFVVAWMAWRNRAFIDTFPAKDVK